MTKSRGNTIDLKDRRGRREPEGALDVHRPDAAARDRPGHVEGNPVFMYHDAFNPDIDEVNDLKERYVLGKVGDVEVKQKLAKALNNFLDADPREARLLRGSPG